MLTILSPAKTLDFETEVRVAEETSPLFQKEANELVKLLREYKIDDLSKLMKVSYEIAALNVERFAHWHINGMNTQSKQALLAFKGEVYRGLQAESMSSDELKFAQRHLRILSGLYGVLRPLDRIQPYRLEMGTKLENGHGKNLYDFWGEKITEQLNKDLQKQKEQLLINLSSNEYYKAIDKKKIQGDVITPVFKEKKGNTYKVIAVYAKKARGLMTRFIIDNRIEQSADLKAFDEGGYVFDSDLSTAKEWVFVR
jgi:cytoplasmic iron level regulating protein YaaA (DUF328/UPF0246 family)